MVFKRKKKESPKNKAVQSEQSTSSNPTLAVLYCMEQGLIRYIAICEDAINSSLHTNIFTSKIEAAKQFMDAVRKQIKKAKFIEEAPKRLTDLTDKLKKYHADQQEETGLKWILNELDKEDANTN